MAAHNRNQWLPYQMDLLARLIDGNSTYEDASHLVGHTVLACRTKMSEIRSKRRDGDVLPKARPEPPPLPLRKRKTLAKRPLAPILPTVLCDAPYARTNTSTAKLVADAELRARISVLGITAGLLGDPLPGRSALDQKRNTTTGENHASHY